MRVVLDAAAIGASPTFETLPLEEVTVGEVITGRRVERDSGRRRVRKRVEDWR